MNAPLNFKAGPKARALIAEKGLQPDGFAAMSGAAGGPKWLVLAEMDRLIFGDWLQSRTRPLPLVGASIGSWRFAAAAQQNAVAAFDELERLYIEQSYSLKPSYQEVTSTARALVAELLGDGGAEAILSHPWARLHIVTALCRGWTGRDSRFPMSVGFGAATLTNTLSRDALACFLERHIYADGRDSLDKEVFPGFATQVRQLSTGNLADVLLASGSIPFVMEAVQIAAESGRYRDGGMVDYHMDLPLSEDLVLMPHFSKLIVPGWLDKFVPWRKPRYLDNTLVIHPSDEWIASLPNRKIPDRKDFQAYRHDNDERIKVWREVVGRSRELADFLHERLQRQDLTDYLEPL